MAPTKYVSEVGLFDELKLALSRTTADDLKAWSTESVGRVPTITKRRIRNFGALVSGLGKAVGEEVGHGVHAWKRGVFATHLGQRTAAGIDTTLDFGKRTWRALELVSKAVLDDPKKNAPGVLALALGFIAGSGGVDANGGVPDTDIAMFGIGDHRSLFTHSIIAGIVVESSILALADLAGVVCDKLPPDERSEFWGQISSTKDQIATQLSAGASAGIAYHLAIDATLQPAAYKDLPVSMPIEAHQMLFALNAVVEGRDAVERVQTPGEKAVAAVTDGMSAVEARLRTLLGRK